MFYCEFCHERWFDMKASRNDETKCEECAKGKTNPPVWSPLNDVYPYHPHGYPFHLPQLTQIEEMLIARSHVVMVCMQIAGGNVQYRGNVLNIQQNSERIFEHVPLLPSDLPCFIVRKPTQSVAALRQSLQNFQDFRVSRVKLQMWITFLMNNNPLYCRTVQVSEANMQQIPLDGSIADMLPIIEEQAGVTDDSPNEISTPVATDTTIAGADAMEISNPLELGPAHNGASGIPSEEDPVRKHYLPQPIVPPKNQEAVIARYLQENFVGTAQNPMNWPQGTRYMSEYSDSNLLCSAFPTLYPYGPKGDVTFRDRRLPVLFADANRHFLRYAIKIPGTEKFCYPFAEHHRWSYYVFNIAERHQAESQRSFFLKKHPNVANMTAAQLRELVNQPERRAELMQVVSLMQSYNANINGSDSYLVKSRQRLECLIAQDGMPTFYFTFTAADNHWANLHQHFNMKNDLDNLNESEKAKLRRKMVRDNPHLVDHYFHSRVKLLLKKWFTDAGLPIKWSWFRIEYQERGTAHAHGCLRLECDPNISLLAKNVAQARQLQIILQHQNIVLAEGEYFSTDETRDDKLLMDDADLQQAFTKEQVVSLKKTIADGVKAHRIIINFQDFLLTTSHPNPPSDAATERDEATRGFVENATNKHPTSLPLPTVLGQSIPEQRQHYCQLINTVERHKCQKYCLRPKRNKANNDGNSNGNHDNLECRFDFPKSLTNNTHLAIIMKKVGHGNTLRKHTSIEMKSNSHSESLMRAWQANMDIQLTIDIGKITQYMTKYMTKSEQSMPLSISRLVNQLLTCRKPDLVEVQD